VGVEGLEGVLQLDVLHDLLVVLPDALFQLSEILFQHLVDELLNLGDSRLVGILPVIGSYTCCIHLYFYHLLGLSVSFCVVFWIYLHCLGIKKKSKFIRISGLFTSRFFFFSLQ